MPPVKSETKDAIHSLILKAKQEPVSSVNRTVADAVGALSVYADIGGSLALTPEGRLSIMISKMVPPAFRMRISRNLPE